MTLHVENLTINIGSAMPPIEGTLISSVLSSFDPAEQPRATSRPAIGEYWQGQGGIFAGDFRGGDGVVYGLIISTDEDAGRANWGEYGERELSDWDGLINTSKLRNDCPAAKLASSHTRDGHTDFYLPARRELQFAGANLHHIFGTESWYWSSTAHGEHYAWAVDFESGYTLNDSRTNGFRVRPVRRFIY